MLKAKLVVVGGDAKAAEISLKLPTVIGRGREASLTLPHPLVSRQHCELFEKEGLLHVRDMKSLNGTYVDSKRIEASSILNPDQLLTIGNVTFRAVYSPSDSSVAELKANTSNVIEFDEVNSSEDSDSQIDAPVDNSRPTVRGKETPLSKKDMLETISSSDLDQRLAGNSDVLHDFEESAPEPAVAGPQHSIVAAMNQAGVAADIKEDASLNDLRTQLPVEQRQEVGGELNDLVVDSKHSQAEQADFSSINLDEHEASKISDDEQALGSFIRKLPR